MAEARVVVEIEAQARRVQEDELSRYANLEFPFAAHQLSRVRRRFLERLLHRDVLHGIQLDRAQRTVDRDDEAASRTANEGIATDVDIHRARLRGRGGG